MDGPPVNEVLISILMMLRKQTDYLHRQHGWLIAVTEAVERHPDLVPHLKGHPFYNQGPRSDVQITQNMLQSIDALIEQLRKTPVH